VTALADRSMEPIELADLHRLAEIAADVEADLFARHPAGSGRYADRLLCRALCQGAGLHFADHAAGLKTSAYGPLTPSIPADPCRPDGVAPPISVRRNRPLFG
jgi:hypothetical protein